MSNIIIDDIFEIKKIDDNKKKFDKVSRIYGKSENYEMEVTLDLNTDIYPVEINDKLTLVLARSLSTSGEVTEEKDAYDPSELSSPNLMDQYEYVMYGMVFKCSLPKDSKLLEIFFFSSFVSKASLLLILSKNANSFKKSSILQKILNSVN